MAFFSQSKYGSLWAAAPHTDCMVTTFKEISVNLKKKLVNRMHDKLPKLAYSYNSTGQGNLERTASRWQD